MDIVDLALGVKNVLDQVEHYRGRVVPYEVWWDLALDTLDSNDEVTFRWYPVYQELSKRFLAGQAGYLYLEHLPKEEYDVFIIELRDRWDNPKEYEYSARKVASTYAEFEQWVVAPAMIPTDPNDPSFCEVWCDEAELTAYEHRILADAHTPGWILNARQAARDPVMQRLNRKYGG